MLSSGALWENVEALKTIGRAPSPEEKLEEPKRLEAGIFVMVRGTKTLVASQHCLYVESFAVWKVVIHSKGKYFNISFDIELNFSTQIQILHPLPLNSNMKR